MSPALLKLYQRLPWPLQFLAASARGWQLKRWRYGPETDRLVAEALARDTWTDEQWKRWHDERLNHVLLRAAHQVPYYRDYWRKRRMGGDRSSCEQLENWPILTKEELRANPHAFVADDCRIETMFPEQTSGTTGKPLRLWWSRRTVQGWYALIEARLRRWGRVNREENWAILGGQPIISASVKRPPFWVWNAPMKQLYLSANHISPQNAPAFIDALVKYNVTHMIVYSSSASLLAQFARERGLPKPPALKRVFTNAEPLLPWQRESIQNGLCAEVRESYGMAEIVAAASECDRGSLHVWPEVGHVEVLADESDAPVGAGTAGRLICTHLLNEDMPLIRYAVLDRAGFRAGREICACGRSLPILNAIAGRSNDLLIARDGRRVFWVNPVFYSLPVREAQIVQESLDLIRVNVIPGDGFTPQTGETITARLRERVGPVHVELNRVTEIPAGPGGKFRAIICNVKLPERPAAATKAAQ